MSKRPRLSSVQVLENAELICIRYDQFESLIGQMSPVAMKIIRYFSHRLRKYNATLSSLTNEALPIGKMNLYTLGQYYQHNGYVDIAGLAYTKFIEYCPNSPKCQDAYEQLQVLGYHKDNATTPVKNGIQVSYEAGMPIFLDQEIGSDLYVILDGHVKITKISDNNEILLGMLHERDIFGEMAILENSARSASAIAATKVNLLRINKQNFELYIKSHPEIARRIIELLSDRIWLIYKRLANQVISDPIVKIYDALQTLLQKNRIPLTKGATYTFEMSPEEIIQFIGMDSILGKQIMDKIIASDPVLLVDDNRLVSKDVYSIRGAIASANRKLTRIK